MNKPTHMEAHLTSLTRCMKTEIEVSDLPAASACHFGLPLCGKGCGHVRTQSLALHSECSEGIECRRGTARQGSECSEGRGDDAGEQRAQMNPLKCDT